MSAEPLLHVAFEAQCEIAAGRGGGGKYVNIGLALDPTAGLSIALGQVGSPRIVTFGATTIKMVHHKFMGSGKLTFEVGTGHQGTRQVLVKNADPEVLKGILATLDEGQRALIIVEKQADQRAHRAPLVARFALVQPRSGREPATYVSSRRMSASRCCRRGTRSKSRSSWQPCGRRHTRTSHSHKRGTRG